MKVYFAPETAMVKTLMAISLLQTSGGMSGGGNIGNGDDNTPTDDI